jgi:hypothetical protein
MLHHKWTPAEVSQILFRRVADVNGAIDDLLNEDPKKLFKFSQLKQAGNDEQSGDKQCDDEQDYNKQGETRQETKEIASIDSLEESEEEKATLLTTLEEQSAPPPRTASDSSSLAQKKKIRQ